MNEKMKKYDDIINDDCDKSLNASEPAVKLESTAAEKIAYLKENLDPSTVAYLEPLNFMLDKPFPYDEYDERWFEESDEDNPPVSADVINHDREVWINAI